MFIWSNHIFTSSCFLQFGLQPTDQSSTQTIHTYLQIKSNNVLIIKIFGHCLHIHHICIDPTIGNVHTLWFWNSFWNTHTNYVVDIIFFYQTIGCIGKAIKSKMLCVDRVADCYLWPEQRTANKMKQRKTLWLHILNKL